HARDRLGDRGTGVAQPLGDPSSHRRDPGFVELEHRLEVHLGGVGEITAHGDPPPYVQDWMRSSLVRAGPGDTGFARTGSHIDAPAPPGPQGRRPRRRRRADSPVGARRANGSVPRQEEGCGSSSRKVTRLPKGSPTVTVRPQGWRWRSRPGRTKRRAQSILQPRKPRWLPSALATSKIRSTGATRCLADDYETRH